MNRSLAALCLLSLSSSAFAGTTYVTDGRFVQAVNSFGQNAAHTPPVAFAPFNDTVQTSTSIKIPQMTRSQQQAAAATTASRRPHSGARPLRTPA